MVQRREPTLISTTQKYNVDPVGDGNVQQYSENALAKLEELLAEVDYECEKLGVLKDLTANLCTDQQLTDLNAHAVKAYGQDWRKVNGRDGSGGSEHTGQLTCAAKGCRNKLSKAPGSHYLLDRSHNQMLPAQRLQKRWQDPLPSG
jgi:hypothetical protein